MRYQRGRCRVVRTGKQIVSDTVELQSTNIWHWQDIVKTFAQTFFHLQIQLLKILLMILTRWQGELPQKIKRRMPVVLVTMKLLNGFFRKAKATPCCITESETESKILIRRHFSNSSKHKFRNTLLHSWALTRFRQSAYALLQGHRQQKEWFAWAGGRQPTQAEEGKRRKVDSIENHAKRYIWGGERLKTYSYPATEICALEDLHRPGSVSIDQ